MGYLHPLPCGRFYLGVNLSAQLSLKTFPFFTVKPFLNEEEYQRTEDIVKKFENGIGKELHQKLVERAKTRRNWVCIKICKK